MPKIDIISDIIANAVNVQTILNILKTKGISITQKEWDEARDAALSALQGKFGYEIVKLEYSFEEMKRELLRVLPQRFEDEQYREAYGHLRSLKVERLEELQRLVEDQDAIQWLKAVYRTELLRPAQNPLDPSAICTWGIRLIRASDRKGAKKQVTGEIRGTKEASENRLRLFERQLVDRLNREGPPREIAALGTRVSVSAVRNLTFSEIHFQEGVDSMHGSGELVVTVIRHAGDDPRNRVLSQHQESVPFTFDANLNKVQRQLRQFSLMVEDSD